jgi:hypothetical protein
VYRLAGKVHESADEHLLQLGLGPLSGFVEELWKSVDYVDLRRCQRLPAVGVR